jgi:hypothetical protein
MRFDGRTKKTEAAEADSPGRPFFARIAVDSPAHVVLNEWRL